MNRAGDYIILNKNLTEQDILCGRYEGEQGIFVKRELCGDVVALFNDNYATIISTNTYKQV